MQQSRGPRALHPRQVVRIDPDETARMIALDPEPDEIADARARHRRPTVRMSPLEIERAIAESPPPAPARSRLARGSEQLDVTPPPALVAPPFALELDPDPDPALLLLPFRARRPVLATAITIALAVGLLLVIYQLIAAS